MRDQTKLFAFFAFCIFPALARLCRPHALVGATDAQLGGVISLVLTTDTDNPVAVDQRMGIYISSDLTGTNFVVGGVSMPVGWANAPTFGETPFTNASMFDWFGFPQISRFGNEPYVNLTAGSTGIPLNETHIFNETYWSGRFHASYDFADTTNYWMNITLCGNATAELLSECQPTWNTWLFNCDGTFPPPWEHRNGARVFAPSSLSTANELTFSHPTTNINNGATTNPLVLWSDTAPTSDHIEILRLRAGAGDGNVTVGCSVQLDGIRGRAGRDVLNAPRDPMLLRFSETLQSATGGPVWSYPSSIAELSKTAYVAAGGGTAEELTIQELQSNFLALHDDYVFGENVDFNRILHALNLPNSGILVADPFLSVTATMDGNSGAWTLVYWRFAQSSESSSSTYPFTFPYSKHFWTVTAVEPFQKLTTDGPQESMTPVLAATITSAGFSDDELCASALDPLAEPTGLDDSVEPTLDHPTGFYTYKHPFFSSGSRLLNFEACAWDQSGDTTYVCSLQFDVHRAPHVADVRTSPVAIVDLQTAFSGFLKLQILNVTVLNGTYVDTHDNTTYEEPQPIWMRFKGRTPGTNSVPSTGIAYPSTLDFENAESNDLAFEIFFCEYPEECTGNSTLASQNSNDLIKWYAPTVNGDIDFTDDLDGQVTGKTAVYSSLHEYKTRADSKPGPLNVVLDTDMGIDLVTHDVYVVVRSPAQPDLTIVREWGGVTDTIVGIPTLVETMFAPMPTLSPLFFCYDFLLPYGPSTNFTKFETPSHTRLRGQWTAPADGLAKIGTITINPGTREFVLSLDSTASCAMSELSAETTTEVSGSFPKRISSTDDSMPAVGTWTATTAPTEITWQRSGVVAYELLEQFPGSSLLQSGAYDHYARITFTSFMAQGAETMSVSANTDFFIGVRAYTPDTPDVPPGGSKKTTAVVIAIIAVGVVLGVLIAAVLFRVIRGRGVYRSVRTDEKTN